MAKSIFTTINEKEFLIRHEANEATFNLPEYLKDLTIEILEDEEKLLTWTQDYEILHGLLHYGLQELIIKLRQTARPPVKLETDTETGKEINVGKSIIEDKIAAQQRINDFVIKPLKKPGSSAANKVTEALEKQQKKMRTVLKSLGKSDDEIEVLLEQLK